MKKLLADTLFKRLFLLMWLALVLSHLAGLTSMQAWFSSQDSGADRPGLHRMPAVPSLPPMALPDGPGGLDGPDGLDGGDRPDRRDDGFGGRPLSNMLWLDYLVRVLVIGVAAWYGARWLSEPMHRLADASRALGDALGSQRRPPTLDEEGGTEEVRQTAEVFNAMALRLHDQFQAQGLMMAAISHDLRTPLARLRLRLEQMEPDANIERGIGDVREMDQLIGSVLEVMRLGLDAAPAQRVDVQALVQSQADDLAEQGQPVQVAVLPDGAAAVALADPTALGRVIGNLVSNALRHGGSAEVSFALHEKAVTVWIDDHGPGIPAAELERVFQPFYRIDTSRNRQGGGTGLGLYIARDLVQRHGGTLTLVNRPAGGLRAELTLRRAA